MKLKDLRVFQNCKEMNVSIWSCPQFLFLLMGMFIATSSVTIYFVGIKYIQDFYIIAVMAIIANVFLLILSFFITHSFEKTLQASRMKSELTSIIIHQIRSPLTNIKWALGNIDLGELKEPIDKNIERMTELANDLLIVTKIEQGGFQLNKKNFYLNELAQEVIDSYMGVGKLNNIKIEPYLKKIQVFADYSQLRLVIENLLDNAIRYSENKGKVEINVYKEGSFAFFKIKDQGVGIPKKDQKNVFQKFFRSDNKLKEKIKGSGLGLYIAQQIIKQHNGKIWFYSQEGKGTTFYFSLKK